jgi:hypothetical protein
VQATGHGAIQTVATDEICCPHKVAGPPHRRQDRRQCRGQPCLSLIYAEIVRVAESHEAD